MSRVTKRRVVLIVVACCSLVADAGWLFLRQKEMPDFLLQPTEQVVLMDTDPATIPVFSERHGRWVRNGKVIPSIIPFLRDDDPKGVGPDSIGMSAIVRLEGNPAAQVARQAFMLLASEGVCQVALFSADLDAQAERLPEAPVVRLLGVRDDDGLMRPCVDRINLNRRVSANSR